jgi:mycofactocin system creatininase family protein
VPQPAEVAGHRLDCLAWPDAAGRAAASVLAVPVGSTEQHGPHLPIGTDSAVAVALTERLAAARTDVIVAPLLAYGSAGEHAAFSGTLSIGAAALEMVLVELVRSADAFAGVVLVSGHGGNAAPLAAAVATLQTEEREVLAWTPRIPGGDAHAGRTETSLMLALAPESVRLEAAEPGDARPLAAVIGELRRGGVASVSANGVLGDPTGANADEGRGLLDTLAADLVTAVEAWRR